MISSEELFSSIPYEWHDACGIPSWACDVASGARAVKALLYYDSTASPLEGFAILISSHVLLLDDLGGQPVFWLAMRTVEGLRCTERVMLPRNSFACSIDDELSCVEGKGDEASRVVTMDFFSSAATVSMKLAGLGGEQFARTALSLWHLHRNCDAKYGVSNGKSENPFAVCQTASVWHPGDALYACAGAPVRLSALLLQHPTDLTSDTAVDLVMFDVDNLCIMRKPFTSAVDSWQTFLLSSEVERLDLGDLALLSLHAHTKLRLVDHHGAVWAFGIADDLSTQSATRRLVELCLFGLLRKCVPRRGKGLRHGDIAALHRQYVALDPAGVGYALRTALEAAIGPLLSCDTRVMAAVGWGCCESGEDNEHDGTHGAMAPAKLSLASYVSGMRVLLQGSAEERAALAFRAFVAESEGEGAGLEDTVRPADFQRTARDILSGLRLTERVDAVTAAIPGDPMSFKVFRSAYDELVAVTSSAERVHMQAKLPAPALGFGSEHWVQLTYVMTGIETATRTASGNDSKSVALLDSVCFADKRTFDLSQSSPTITSCCDAPLLGAMGVASKFFRKRIPPTQDDRTTFSDYASSVFLMIRRRFGFCEESYVDALGIRALRARLLLGRLCSPRDLHSSGRSGSLLLSSHDGQFVLKTILPSESQMLRRNLPFYVTHVERYAHTFLPRYTGLYSLTRNGEKKVFVVAENVFAPGECPIAEVYDLKGSTIHRTTGPEDRRNGAAGKDNDFIKEQRRLRLSVEAREALLAQLDVDTAMLESCNALDYSLLVGIHRANGKKETYEGAAARQAQREQLRSLIAELHESGYYNNSNSNSNSSNKTKTADALPGINCGARVQTTEEIESNQTADNEEKRNKSFNELAQPSAFRAYRGGLSSADGSEIYCFGFVDCLTAYGLKKVGEHYCKSMILLDMKGVSCVPPANYRARFIEFIRSVIDVAEGT